MVTRNVGAPSPQRTTVRSGRTISHGTPADSRTLARMRARRPGTACAVADAGSSLIWVTSSLHRVRLRRHAAQDARGEPEAGIELAGSERGTEDVAVMVVVAERLAAGEVAENALPERDGVGAEVVELARAVAVADRVHQTAEHHVGHDAREPEREDRRAGSDAGRDLQVEVEERDPFPVEEVQHALVAELAQIPRLRELAIPSHPLRDVEPRQQRYFPNSFAIRRMRILLGIRMDVMMLMRRDPCQDRRARRRPEPDPDHPLDPARIRDRAVRRPAMQDRRGEIEIQLTENHSGKAGDRDRGPGWGCPPHFSTSGCGSRGLAVSRRICYRVTA